MIFLEKYCCDDSMYIGACALEFDCGDCCVYFQMIMNSFFSFSSV